jgi:hypothetical protein
MASLVLTVCVIRCPQNTLDVRPCYIAGRAALRSPSAAKSLPSTLTPLLAFDLFKIARIYRHRPSLGTNVCSTCDAIIDRLGETGRRYVEAVERKAPHAPLAFLREVIQRTDEYGVATVRAAIESLMQFSVVKRGTLSTLCYRFGGTPRVVTPGMRSLPHVDVEQRSLSVYDGAAA